MFNKSQSKSQNESQSLYKKSLRPILSTVLALIMAIPFTFCSPTPALGKDYPSSAYPSSAVVTNPSPVLEEDNPGSALGTDDTLAPLTRPYDPQSIRLVVEVTPGTDLYALAATSGGELVRTGPLNYCVLEFDSKNLEKKSNISRTNNNNTAEINNVNEPDFRKELNQNQLNKIKNTVLAFPGVKSAEWSKTYTLSDFISSQNLENNTSLSPQIDSNDQSSKAVTKAATMIAAGSLTGASTENLAENPEESGKITVNDPEYTLQWALQRIRAERAWAEGATGKGVIIAVVDTGVDLDHPDLVDNVRHKSNLIQGYNAFTRSALPGAEQDDNGHGTSVAGAIAALMNDVGIVGVAPEAMIMPIKAMDHAGEGEDSIIADGIIWAVNHGAKIINMSIGSDTQAKVLDDALQYAKDKGCLLVAASGNNKTYTKNGQNLQQEKAAGKNAVAYPAAHPAVLAVSAVDMHDNIAPFSLTGPEIALSAPGEKILTTYWSKEETGYSYSTGTSIAAPFVSGAAALLWSKYPELTADEIKQALFSSAYDLGAKGRDNDYGFGRLDVYRALQTFKEQETYYSTAALGWEGGKIYVGGTAEEPAAILTVPKDTFPLRVTGMGVEEKINISLQTSISAEDFPMGIVPASETIVLEPWGEMPVRKALSLSLKLTPPAENAALPQFRAAKAATSFKANGNENTNIESDNKLDNKLSNTKANGQNDIQNDNEANNLIKSNDLIKPEMEPEMEPLPEPVLTAYLYKWNGSRWLKVGGGVTDPAKILEATIYEPGIYRAGWSLENNTERLAGDDRIATALEIALEAFPGGADTIIIARADDFPDALAGAPLAYKLQAPILLTYPEELPDEVYRFIANYKPKKIYLLGGTGAISPAVERRLSELAYTYRIAGKNRYATAAAVADMLGTTGQAIIVNGLNFPDAIAAASYAALQGKPILLTPTNDLAPETAEALRRFSVTQAEVIGGPAVVSNEVIEQLICPKRISGANRFATSAEVIRRNMAAGDILYIATGMAFPDALTGGLLAALNSSNILLLPPSGPTPEQTKLLEALQVKRIIALGGEEAVSEDTLVNLKKGKS